MANESTTGGPLTATVGEQLAGKGHLGEAEEAGKGAIPQAGPEVERHEAGGEPRARRSAASRLPWGAIVAAGAGWVLAKTIARGLRRR